MQVQKDTAAVLYIMVALWKYSQAKTLFHGGR